MSDPPRRSKPERDSLSGDRASELPQVYPDRDDPDWIKEVPKRRAAREAAMKRMAERRRDRPTGDDSDPRSAQDSVPPSP